MKTLVIPSEQSAPVVVTAKSGPEGPPGPVGPVGPVGPPGPQGEDGAEIIAVPYDEWPPADPQPNTLYLRLAP